MKKISVELSAQEAEMLEALAKRLKIPAEQLAQVTLSDLLGQSVEDLRKAVEYAIKRKQDIERHSTEGPGRSPEQHGMES